MIIEFKQQLCGKLVAHTHTHTHTHTHKVLYHPPTRARVVRLLKAQGDRLAYYELKATGVWITQLSGSDVLLQNCGFETYTSVPSV